jgi:hypothetical protein
MAEIRNTWWSSSAEIFERYIEIRPSLIFRKDFCFFSFCKICLLLMTQIVVNYYNYKINMTLAIFAVSKLRSTFMIDISLPFVIRVKDIQ